jgi:tRNA(fMet)-specific endonuclease VapC
MNNDNVRVLDTDVTSFIFKGGESASRFLPLIRNRVAAVSFVTIGEMLHGAYIAKWSTAHVDRMMSHIRENYLVLPYTFQVTEEWARLMAACKGATPGLNDARIAATATAYGCPVISNDAGLKRIAANYPKLTVLP